MLKTTVFAGRKETSWRARIIISSVACKFIEDIGRKYFNGSSN